MDILKKQLAPITNEAWEEIQEAATDVLTANLSARKIVDVEGPKGWDFAAVPLGRLQEVKQKKKTDIEYGIRTVQPLVEPRILCELDVWELDNVTRGAKDVDLESLENAAREIAQFEERAIYEGLDDAGIKGLRASAEHKAQTFSGEPRNLLQAISAGMTEFSRAGVEGPYRLVCGAELWQHVSAQDHGYPLTRHLEQLLNSEIILNPHLDDSLLVSVRGGDMKLTLGVDFSIGFNTADAKKVSLYLTESFTFQVLDGAAIIPIEWKKRKK